MDTTHDFCKYIIGGEAVAIVALFWAFVDQVRKNEQRHKREIEAANRAIEIIGGKHDTVH